MSVPEHAKMTWKARIQRLVDHYGNVQMASDITRVGNSTFNNWLSYETRPNNRRAITFERDVLEPFEATGGADTHQIAKSGLSGGNQSDTVGAIQRGESNLIEMVPGPMLLKLTEAVDKNTKALEVLIKMQSEILEQMRAQLPIPKKAKRA